MKSSYSINIHTHTYIIFIFMYYKSKKQMKAIFFCKYLDYNWQLIVFVCLLCMCIYMFLDKINWKWVIFTCKLFHLNFKHTSDDFPLKTPFNYNIFRNVIWEFILLLNVIMLNLDIKFHLSAIMYFINHWIPSIWIDCVIYIVMFIQMDIFISIALVCMIFRTEIDGCFIKYF